MARGQIRMPEPDTTPAPRYLRPSHGFTLLLLCLLLLLARVAASVPVGKALFEQITFVMPGHVRHVIAEDMDGDGLKDLLVFYTKGEYPHPERRGCIFWQIRTRGFPKEPQQCWPVPPSASLVDTGNNVDGLPGREIFYMTPEGVLYSPLTDKTYGNPTPLIMQDTYIRSSSVNALPEVDFVRDWDGDGQDEVLVFKREEAVFFKRRPDGSLARWSEIRLTPRTYLAIPPPPPSLDRNFMVRQSIWMPEIETADFNGDGKRDLIVIWMDEVSIYLQGESGLFPREPSATYFFNLLTEKERATGRATVHVEVRDLQGDGRADFVLSKVEGGIINAKSKILIYYNKNNELKPDSPDLILADAKGAAGGIVHDLDGDGRPDLIVPSVRLSALSYIGLFINREVTVSFAFYLMGQDGRYPDKPRLEKELKFAIDLQEGDIVGALPRLHGDFDGNGRKDVVFATNKDRLTVVLQGSGEIFPSSRSYAIEVPVSKEMVVEDLDGDGLSDIIMFYPFHESLREVLIFLRNQWKKPSH